MASQRGEFGSRFGFIMAAAGSAVGLGNIWGFPTQAASNGGAAFVVVYLLLAFLLAYPVLMAELTLGRHAHGNMIIALAKVSRNGTQRGIGTLVGIVGIFTASLILSFYAIVSGWMIGFGAAYPLDALGASRDSNMAVRVRSVAEPYVDAHLYDTDHGRGCWWCRKRDRALVKTPNAGAHRDAYFAVAVCDDT